MIPVKITMKGEGGRLLVGLAKQQMSILKRQRELGLKDTRRVISPFQGVVIECIVGKHPEEIRIFTGGKYGEQHQQGEEKKVYDCFCNCNFSAGIVVDVTGKLDEANLYSVSVCNNLTHYILYENILASDFTLYGKGQKVIVIPYNANTFLCCTGGQEARGCSPVESTTPQAEDAWRTTYRIIPWCGVSIPKWIERR